MNRVTPTFSRTVLHGNARNKHGITGEFSRFSKKCKDPLARIPRRDEGAAPQLRAFGDLVVKARPPKEKAQSKKGSVVTFSKETRFTIPSSAQNGNIVAQTVIRSLEHRSDMLRELRSYNKVHNFESDSDHEIELLA